MKTGGDVQTARNNTNPDLSLCDREPIHIPGSIQPHGCLIACILPAWTVSAVSANAMEFLGREPGVLFDLPLDEVLPARTVHDLRNVLQSAMVSGGAERLVAAQIDSGTALYDLTVHISGFYTIIEILPRTGTDQVSADPVVLVRSMMARLKRAPSLERFLHLAASQVRAVCGFDRVMVYKFLADGSGQVVAESIRSGMPPFLGLRYPASDIPAQARALYQKQWLRLIPDTAYVPVALLRPAAATDDIDLSLATLRSSSPVHIEYLRNMGSRATLTISLLEGERLWGLIACHHESPRRISSSTAAAAELFGQIFSLQIEAKEQTQNLRDSAAAREAHDRLLTDLLPDDNMFDNLGRFAEKLLALVPCDGMAVYSDKGYLTAGTTPPQTVADALIDFLGDQPGAAPFVTDSLGQVLPMARSSEAQVSGVLAIPFTRTPRDYLIFFRQEVLQTVTWGGNPHKPVEIHDDGARISPRKSFEAWREQVSGRSLPWTAAEVQTAETLRVSLLEIILRRSDLVSKERQSARESQAFLSAELFHRVRNIRARVRSLVRQTRLGAKSVDTFADDLERRVSSLALAHDQLTITGWKNAPLRPLLDAEVRAWANESIRFRFEGPPVSLVPRAFQALALVFHELVTNAAKYGSLSSPAGHLSVVWSRDAEQNLCIDWDETGGPPVTPPVKQGFGSVVVEQVIPFELGGRASLDYRREGLHARFSIPAAHVSDSEAEQETLVLPEPRLDSALERLLLVEDSMMIALDAQAMLRERGLETEVAGTVADAGRLLDIHAFDAAILDVNLSGETSFDIADELLRRRLPFVFATGYGESIVIPDRFRGVPVVSKPYDAPTLASALRTARLAAAS